MYIGGRLFPQARTASFRGDGDENSPTGLLELTFVPLAETFAIKKVRFFLDILSLSQGADACSTLDDSPITLAQVTVLRRELSDPEGRDATVWRSFD